MKSLIALHEELRIVEEGLLKLVSAVEKAQRACTRAQKRATVLLQRLLEARGYTARKRERNCIVAEKGGRRVCILLPPFSEPAAVVFERGRVKAAFGLEELIELL